MPCYFFSGTEYIRVTRGQLGPGFVDLQYPEPLANWGWGNFGAKGVDAALPSGPKCYFFSGKEYIRVTRGETGAGNLDADYPQPIANWGWGNFGENGIDAALSSGPKCYFFSGDKYMRVTRDDEGPGTPDEDYPQPISNWGWGDFGKHGIDAALNSGPVDYFFSGDQYIRVTRGDEGPGKMDEGYPAPISNWGWGEFGRSGITAALFSGVDTPVGGTEPPPPRLGSNSNYFLHDFGNPLIGVVVTINIEEDLVMKSATLFDGFSFQLNAWGPNDATVGWQQYCILVEDLFGKNFVAFIDNWLPNSSQDPHGIVNKSLVMAPIKEYAIPAGYQLKIALQNDDQNTITGATFTVIDNKGHLIRELFLPIAPPAEPTSPIAAFVLNIVGAHDASRTVFSSGAGSIIYQAINPLSVANDFPEFIESTNFATGEFATSTYGLMPAGPNLGVSQSFGITPDGSFP